MKALGKLKKEPGIWMYDAPEPTCGPNDVRIKIKKTAICGTDMHIYHWDEWAQKTVPVPMTTGHEFSGEIVELGSEVKGFSIGDRVSGEGHLVCGHCRNCRAGRQHICRNTNGIGYDCTGCFSEYFVMPASNVIILNDYVSDDMGAILDPFGNATHTALSFPMVGEDVLITGAGPLGAMAVAICNHVGARHVVVTDVNPYRLKLAAKMGNVRTVNITEESLDDVMKELGMKEGFDIGLEMSGNPQAFNQMLTHMNYGGHIAILGIPPGNTAIDWSQVIFKGLIMKGIYGREMYETWFKMVNMLESGLDLKPIITHRFKVDDYKEAFELMASGQSGKILLEWC